MNEVNAARTIVPPRRASLPRPISLNLKQGGTLDSGHYFAMVKSPTTGRWFECNDARVRAVGEREALEQQRGAYMVRDGR